MTATRTPTGDESGDTIGPVPGDTISPAAAPLAAPAPGESLIGTTSSDKCSVCGADMAPDQHYCVECGTRRGRARFTMPDNNGKGRSQAAAGGAGAGGGASTTGTASPPPRGSWISSASLLAGIAVLLIAVGVGFLIGHNNGSTSKSTPPHYTFNVGGGTGSGSTSAGTSGTSGSSSAGTSGTSASSGSSKSKGSSGTVKKSTSTKGAAKAAASNLKSSKVSSAASKSASQVLGTSGTVSIASPTTTVGGTCSANTAGCTNGHFTGSFFGGGG
jgi:hypothetical protein